MNKLLILTLAFAIVPTVALTKEDDDCSDPSRKCHGQVISPEDLFQEAKKHCDESATTPEGWGAIRACIAEAKGKVLRERDPRIAKACGKYSGLDGDQCTDWNYIRGPSAPSYTRMRYRAYHADHFGLGRAYPGERGDTSPAATPGGVTGGRNTSKGAYHYNPNSNKSDITGTTGDHSGRAESGGPTQKIHRPGFLGGGGVGASAPARHNPVGGVTVGGATTTSQSVDLSSLKDAVINAARPQCGDDGFIGPCQPTDNRDR
jgi:hypothetical protein